MRKGIHQTYVSCMYHRRQQSWMKNMKQAKYDSHGFFQTRNWDGDHSEWKPLQKQTKVMRKLARK